MKTIIKKSTGDEYTMIAVAKHGKKGSVRQPLVVYQCNATGEFYWRTEAEMESFTMADGNHATENSDEF